MIVWLLVTLLVALIISYAAWNSTYWQRHGLRGGPLGFPICGNMLRFLTAQQHYGEVYEQLYNAYPKEPYIGIYRIFNEPAILVRSQELVKAVMIRNFQNFQNNVLWVDRQRDPIIYNNPFIARDEMWKSRRAEIVPIFTPNKVKTSFSHIKSVCEKLENYIADNLSTNCFEAKNLFSKYTLDVVASAGFGLDAQSFSNSNSDFTQLVDHLFLPNPWSLVETIALLFSPTLGKLINYYYVPVAVQKWLHSIISSVLKNRLNDSTPNNSTDFVQWLIEAKQKVNEPVDTANIVGHCSTFLLEGFETSSSLMAFVLYEYAINPSIQKRALHEIDEVLSRFDGVLSYDSLQEMTYVESTLFETLRLHPPMLALLKHCTKPFLLPTQNENSTALIVQKGTVIVIPVKAIHCDPELYPNPLKFQPERFSSQNDKQRQAGSFLGFGEGPRMCPGMRFGLVQSKAGLVTLLSKYSVHLSEKTKPPLNLAPTVFLTAAKDGIWISFKPREKFI